MADNLRKFTTQEVLNKVYSDSSGNSIGINAATSKETLNAALDTTNSRLNVSLAGGTISGDVTITGDLTVNGGDTNAAYDEIVNGNLHVKSDSGNSTTAFLVEKNDGTDVFTVDTDNDTVTVNGDTLSLVKSNDNAFLKIESTGGGEAIFEMRATTNKTNQIRFFEGTTQRGSINYAHASQSLAFNTGDSGTLALTLDSSQDAIFANTAIFANNKSINFLNTSGAEKSIISFDNSNITKIGDASSSGTLQLNSGDATFANAVMINSSSANYADLTVGGTGDIVALRASSGTAGFTMYEAGTGRFNMTTLNGSNGIAFKVPTTTALTIDSSADATFANNLTVNGDTLSLVKSNNNAFLKIESTAGGEAFIDMRSTTNKTNVIRFFEGTTQKGSVVYSHASQSLTFNTGDSATSKLVLDDNSRISLSNNDSGSNNTIFGKSASPSQAGSNNTIVGENTALAMDGGESHNTVIGNNAMRGADEGASGSIDFNVAIGSSALWGGVLSGTNQVTGNIAIGYQALYKTDDTNPSIGQIAIGHQSLNSMTSGVSNVAVGYQTGNDITIGSNNTILGYQAGATGTHDITGGSNNTLIGYQAKTNNASASNQIVIGKGAEGQADDSVTLGNTSVDRVYAAQDGAAVLYANGTINTSDRRFKENIDDSDLGLEFINKIRTVSYTFIDDKQKDGKIKYGIIAQEVQEVLKESGNEDFAGIKDDNPEKLGADYVQFIAPLIKSVQELTARVKELESK